MTILRFVNKQKIPFLRFRIFTNLILLEKNPPASEGARGTFSKVTFFKSEYFVLPWKYKVKEE
jgi:hypothetical protein